MAGMLVAAHIKLNFLNFIALPITFGIGSEYPFNIFDRSRLLGGNVTRAVKLHLGAVTLCSYTTTIGYASLLFADNQALRSFGRLAISGEIACLLVALLFLPSLLHVLGLHKVGGKVLEHGPIEDRHHGHEHEEEAVPRVAE
jgi:predicted RND superfamily exporter protein